MKLSALAYLLLAVGPAVHAAELTCVFTRPFHTFRLDTQTSQVTVVDPVSRRERAARTLHTKVEDGLQLTVLEDLGRRMTLGYNRDGDGHDGLSRDVYPYTGQLWDNAPYPQYGGCFSATEPVR